MVKKKKVITMVLVKVKSPVYILLTDTENGRPSELFLKGTVP